MSGRFRADAAPRVKGSNPSWLDRDREAPGRATTTAATRVKRYWAGKAPHWANGGEEGEDAEAEEEEDGEEDRRASRPHEETGDRGRRVAKPAVVVGVGAERASRMSPDEETGGGLQSGRRVPQVPRVIERAGGGRGGARASSSSSSDEEEEEDEETIDARRAAMRARLAARRREQEREEEELMPVQDEDDGAGDGPDESGSSSWETDTDASDSDDGPGRKMIKPMFIPKKERETIAERERVEADLDAEWERRDAQKKKRAEESKKLAELETRRENELAEVEANAEASDVDTDDDVDESGEFAAWQRREWARIAADREAREKFIAEREEQERIRNMSEEEKAAWLEANPREEKEKKEKSKMGFMQKYYHKGAFFQEAADDQFGTSGPHEIYKRDFSEATGSDRVDKSALPKAMQVRGDKFGKMGQTKWTHLSAEDTTQFEDNPWADKRSKALEEYQKKMAGNKQSFEKPKHLK